MTPRIHVIPLLILPLAAALAGETDSAKGITIPQVPSRWRFGGGYAQLLGLKAEFSGLGNFESPFTPQALGSGIARDYDNGYVHIDSSGNAGGETWNWSYDNSSQYDPAGTGSIDFSISNSIANGDAHDRGSSEPGFELFAYYEMGPADLTFFKDRKATWGFRGGIQYSRINMGNHDTVSTGFISTIDSFELGGTVPPLAPYTGSFGGPGPLLGDDPSRSSVLNNSGVVSGHRELDTDITVISFGSYLAAPVNSKMDLLLEAGASLGLADGSYNFDSETTIAGLSPRKSQGETTETDILPGFYIGLGGIYQVNDSFALTANGRYQYMSDFELETNHSKASLIFSSTFVISIGAVFSF